MSESRAGLESEVLGAGPPELRGRPVRCGEVTDGSTHSGPTG
ncbi:MAG: hypothetical protein ACETWK_06170 [Candidatus Aminicenantaceae bacterium]